VQPRARKIVETAQRLVKQSQELVDHANVLITEIQAQRVTQRALLQAARMARVNLRVALNRATRPYVKDGAEGMTL
jgi:hypothetical protein